MPAFPMNATGTFGASAKSTANPAAMSEATASMRNTSPTSRLARRVAIVAPTARPRRSKTSTGAVRYARWSASRWKVCWYCNEANEAKPAIEAARKGRAMKMRRRALTFQTVRQASPNDGGGSTGASTTGASPRGAG